MIFKRAAFSALFAMVTFSGASYGDDTELYVTDYSIGNGNTAKVLIIFDNSGSMKTIEEDAPGAYDSETTYEAISSAHSYQDDMVYFTKGVGIDNAGIDIPLSPSDSRRFIEEINGCNQSKPLLKEYGRFTGFVGEYLVKGQTGTWGDLRDNSGANYDTIDCYEDIIESDTANGLNKDGNSHPTGYPIDGVKNGKIPVPYTSNKDSSATQLGKGEVVTLYTANYLRWHAAAVAGVLPTTPQSRLDIAKDAIENVINTTSSVDFGLALFNMNYPSEGYRDGGRIVSGIQTMTPSAKKDLLDTIGGTNAETNTPLCETLFEAYNYFAGNKVDFGKKDNDYSNWYDGNKPPRDKTIETGDNYESPFKVCPDVAYVIYITDGVPSQDSYANDDVIALGRSGVKEQAEDKTVAPDYSSFSENLSSRSYLPALASYLYHNDLVISPETLADGSKTEHMQTVRTFTIGFSKGAEDAAPLLAETAKRGGGDYFAATSGLSLQKALSDALLTIMKTNASFTSPSIASNNFDRTQTFDSAYYAMFLPGTGPRWTGNLKKLKVTSQGVLVDKNGDVAIGEQGNIKDTSCTFWSACSGKTDGNSVTEGGVLEKLKAMTPSNGVSLRTIYTNTASPFAQLKDVAASTLSPLMNIDDVDVPKTVKWLYGYDVDLDNGGSENDYRADIMGDPLHSKPLALNFGDKNSPDVRIMLGTNQGLVHMFKDYDSNGSNEVTESWAFMPKALLSNVGTLQKNVSGAHTVYGMDASPVAYTELDSTGKVEKAYVYMGMRRGGSSYYALNVSKPDSPSLMWTITSSTSGFSELGQSWSDPVVTTIPGHEGPVLIIGGGYDTRYDTDVIPSDPQGKAIYIVNAVSGALIHSFSNSGTNGTEVSGFSDSFPNSVAILDSNNDGKTDRIYATDVGGNVWRLDLAGTDKTKWSAFKFANLGGTGTNDRRFFAEVAVAQTVFSNIAQVTANGTVSTSYQNIPYDAVVVGSGKRPSPTSKDVTDMFFVLQDRNVVTKSFASTDTPAAITLASLYDVTTAAPVTESDNISFGKKIGWMYNFTGVGEKSLTAALIIDGKVYFTSFVPAINSVSELVCTASGQGRLYVFDLHKGTRTYSNTYYELGERVPDTPQIVIPVPESGEDPYIYIIGIGKGEKVGDDYSGTINVGSGLGVNKIYYHINE
ncbi:pilus assembly protein [Shewanella sp. GutDb-MelDb]|uniref:pilus assembly protein n=1 Tax=Shewanella sp. GutDb-MelDb TaxID=2058316 RepID=UPI000C7D25F4|nr:PilC/PilY family type IV pilus protein [Shewanella sp. GutDb-MelDb]PKG57177.1 rRNA (guanine-N1)-methyltransferase [Shewanella sp. GutDb-MelDb]